MKPFYLFVLFFFLTTIKSQAQSIIAQQQTYIDGWYISLNNYTDPFMGFTSYQSVGQTFQSTLTTTISTIEFYMQNVNGPGTADIEIYSCSNSSSWGSLLGTKTGVSLNAAGWVSVNVSSLSISVTAGNYYGFKLIPQDPLQAGIGVEGDAYSDGESWASGGFLGYDYPFKISGLITLPINLLSFTAKNQNNKVSLQWQTASEENSKNFMVQRSVDGGYWHTISTLPAAGHSSQTKNYSYLDNSPMQGSNYYRLVQTDIDGKSSLSATRIINIKEGKGIVVLPNPVRNGMLQVQLNSASTLALYTEDGRLIWKSQLNAGKQNINLPGLNKGVYFLQWNNATKKIMMQ